MRRERAGAGRRACGDRPGAGPQGGPLVGRQRIVLEARPGEAETAAGPGDMARDMARTAPAWQVLGVLEG